MGTRNGAINETNFGFVIWSDPKLEKIGSDWLYRNMSLYHKWGLIMVKLQRTKGYLELKNLGVRIIRYELEILEEFWDKACIYRTL